jgi:hypothetical protein
MGTMSCLQMDTGYALVVDLQILVIIMVKYVEIANGLFIDKR